MAMTLTGSGTGTVGVPNIATSISTSSGTVADFTGLPSGTKRVIVEVINVSFTGINPIRVQIGSGSFTTTGYTGVTGVWGAGNGSNSLGGGGFDVSTTLSNVSNTFSGHFILTLLTGNTWVCSMVLGSWGTGSNFFCQCNGYVTIGGALDRVRVTSIGSTDSFDAGTVNIIYE